MIARGQLSLGHIFEQGPLYAYWLGAIYSLFGDTDWPVLLVQLAAGVHTSCLLYWIGRRVSGEATGIAAGVLAALYGPLIYFELLVMKSWVSPWLTTWICLIVLRLFDVRGDSIPRGRYGSSIAVGFLIGLLCLVRENHVLLLLPTGLAIAAAQSASSRWLRLIGPGLMIATCILTTIPATVHNFAVSGRIVWITSGGGEVFYMGWGPDATGYYQNPPFVRPDPFLEHEDFRLEASRRIGEPVDYPQSSQYWMKTALAEAIGNSGRSISLIGRKLLILFNDFEVPDSDFYTAARKIVPAFLWLPTLGWIIGLAALGSLLVPWRDRRWQFLMGILVVHILSVVLTYNFARFRLGMLPVVYLLAGLALVWIVTGKRTPAGRITAVPLRAVGGLAAAVISLMSFLPPPGFAEAGFVPIEEQFIEQLQGRTELLEKARRLESSVGEELSSEEALDIAQAWMTASQRFRATRWLLDSLELNPKNPLAWQYLGVIRGKAGRFDQAAEALHKAIEIKPGDPDLWANLGNAKFHQALQGTFSPAQRVESLKDARSAYATGLEFAPEHPTCQQGITMCDAALQTVETE